MWHRILAIPPLYWGGVALVGAALAVAAHVRTNLHRRGIVQLNLRDQTQTPAVDQRVYWMPLSWIGATLSTIAALALLAKFVSVLRH